MDLRRRHRQAAISLKNVTAFAKRMVGWQR